MNQSFVLITIAHGEIQKYKICQKHKLFFKFVLYFVFFLTFLDDFKWKYFLSITLNSNEFMAYKINPFEV